jgi:hypothetical protein
MIVPPTTASPSAGSSARHPLGSGQVAGLWRLGTESPSGRTGRGGSGLLYRMCPFSTGGRDAACPLSTRGGWGGVQDHVRLPVIVENLEKEQKRARHWKRNKKGAALERRNCFRTTRPGCPEARARARACGAARLAPPRAAAAAKKARARRPGRARLGASPAPPCPAQARRRGSAHGVG